TPPYDLQKTFSCVVPYPRFGFASGTDLANAIAVGRAGVSLGAAFAGYTGISFLTVPFVRDYARRVALRMERSANRRSCHYVPWQICGTEPFAVRFPKEHADEDH